MQKTPDHPVCLVFSEQIERVQYLSDELLALSASYPQLINKYIQTQGGQHDKSDLFTQLFGQLQQLPYEQSTASIYIAGSPHSVQTVANVAEKFGIVPSKIHAVAFTRSTDRFSPRRTIFNRISQLFSHTS